MKMFTATWQKLFVASIACVWLTSILDWMHAPVPFVQAGAVSALFLGCAAILSAIA